jgi:hypothetical protein
MRFLFSFYRNSSVSPPLFNVIIYIFADNNLYSTKQSLISIFENYFVYEELEFILNHRYHSLS